MGFDGSADREIALRLIAFPAKPTETVRLGQSPSACFLVTGMAVRTTALGTVPSNAADEICHPGIVLRQCRQPARYRAFNSVNLTGRKGQAV